MAEAYSNLSYHQLQLGRQECFQGWGDIQQLPIVVSAYQRCREIFDEIGGPVLDIGAGVDKPLRGILDGGSIDYWSLDDDPNGAFSFRSINDLEAHHMFKLMVANQFFEHLTIDASYVVMRALAEHLMPAGRLLITVPNVAHPTRFWAVTHVTPWDYMSLYSLYRLVGLECVEIARYNKTPGPQTDEERRLTAMMARLYRIDWCDSIMVVGQKS